MKYTADNLSNIKLLSNSITNSVAIDPETLLHAIMF